MAAKKAPKTPDTVAPRQVSALPLEPSVPTVSSVLGVLSTGRVLDLCRQFGCEVHEISANKERIVPKLAAVLESRLPAILRELGRDELRAICRRHGLESSARARSDLQALILQAAGLDPESATARPPPGHPDGLPTKGQIGHARHRQWLVDEVEIGIANDSPLVKLVCLDDDDPGRQIDVLWDLELGARVVTPETFGLGNITRLDAPAPVSVGVRFDEFAVARECRTLGPQTGGIDLFSHGWRKNRSVFGIDCFRDFAASLTRSRYAA